MGLLQVAAINAAMSSLIKTITVQPAYLHLIKACMHALLPFAGHTQNQPNRRTGLRHGAAHRHARAVEREGDRLRGRAVLPKQARGGAPCHRHLVRFVLSCWCTHDGGDLFLYASYSSTTHTILFPPHSPCLFGAIMYPLTGLQMDTTRFLKFLGILIVESYAAAGFGMVRTDLGI